MAIDMMVDSAKLNREMLATANALREKGKTEAEIPWEDEIGFEQAVLAIKGGGELNFEVVGGTTPPTNPKENTIWVNTSTEITGWVVSPSQPDSQTEGLVWVRTSDYTGVRFNILEDNEMIQLALETRQYVSGAWIICTAQIYVSGEWKDVVGNYLYNAGDQMTGLTGGWHLKFKGGNDDATASFGSNYITLNQAEIDYGRLETVNKVDTRGYTKLCIEYNITKASGGYQNATLGVSSTQTPNTNTNGSRYVSLGTSVSAGIKTLDISTLTDPVYILLSIVGVMNINVIRVWLE